MAKVSYFRQGTDVSITWHEVCSCWSGGAAPARALYSFNIAMALLSMSHYRWNVGVGLFEHLTGLATLQDQLVWRQYGKKLSGSFKSRSFPTVPDGQLIDGILPS